AKGSNSSESWINAFTELQSAVNLSLHGCVDTIRVAQGTYYPLNRPGITDETTARYHTFYLNKPVALLGGYPSGGGSRNPSVNWTFLQDTGYCMHLLLIADNDHVLLDGF